VSGLVLREDAGAVAVLTLNRPDKLNALSPELFVELRSHIDAIAGAGDAVRVVVIRGAGRSFCAGADMVALKAGVVTEDPEFRSHTIQRLGELPQAVIAAVHGNCYTGGMELALAADIIVAARDARFRDTHAALGILPRWGLSARLPRRVGRAAALRISLSGDVVEAEEALRIGLCDYVAAPAEHISFTMGLAARIAAHATTGAIKHLYDRALEMPLDAALDCERRYTKPGGRPAGKE
jgi:enoyl-CoA hydratase